MALAIDGKTYDETTFSIELRNKIVARQEIEASKVRHNVELEKIQVLTEYYNKKILDLMEKEKVQPIKDIQDNATIPEVASDPITEVKFVLVLVDA